MVLSPHVSILLQEFLLGYLSLFEFLLDLHRLLIDSLGFLLDYFHELLLVDCRFLLVVFFEKISKLVLLLIKFVVQFLVLCKLRLNGFVLLSVGFCELKSMVSGLFVKFLNL